jgi:hypothetical protein
VAAQDAIVNFFPSAAVEQRRDNIKAAATVWAPEDVESNRVHKIRLHKTDEVDISQS